MTSMRIAETPEARKDAVPEGRPACAKRIGAYWAILVRACARMWGEKWNKTHIKHSINARKLHHSKNKQPKRGPHPISSFEDIRNSPPH